MGWMRTHHREHAPTKPNKPKKPQALPPLKRKPSAPLTAAEIAHVQRWLANGRAQASLKVSQPQDAQEIEADETAERVMRAPESADLSAGVEHAQRSPLPAQSKPDTAAIAAQLPSLRAEGGRSLPQSELEFMNARFRRNFGGVRIHTGPAAAALAEGVQAKAFTVGNDIVFGENQFQPGTTAGRKLLAHELTHTVQQNGRGANSLQRSPDGAARRPNAVVPAPGVVDWDAAQSDVEAIVDRNRENPLAIAKLLIARSITVSAEVAHGYFLTLAELAVQYPEIESYANTALAAVQARVTSTTDMDPATMGWTDLGRIWLFELEDRYDNIPLEFPAESRLTQEVRALEGVNAGREKALAQLRTQNLQPIQGFWSYGQKQFYEGMLTANTATSFLGSYNYVIQIEPAARSGEYWLSFTVNNTTGWASGSRLRQAEVPGASGSAGLHRAVIPDKKRGIGLRLGGNFSQVWRWKELHRL